MFSFKDELATIVIVAFLFYFREVCRLSCMLSTPENFNASCPQDIEQSNPIDFLKMFKLILLPTIFLLNLVHQSTSNQGLAFYSRIFAISEQFHSSSKLALLVPIFCQNWPLWGSNCIANKEIGNFQSKYSNLSISAKKLPIWPKSCHFFIIRYRWLFANEFNFY